MMGVCCLLYSIIKYASSEDSNSIASKIMLVLFGFPFGLSVGPVTFLYISEILPEIGYAFAIFTNWVVSYMVSQVFVVISNAIEYEGTFFIFAAFCFIGALILKKIMIESKDKRRE